MKYRILEQGGSYYPQSHIGLVGGAWNGFQSAFLKGPVNFSSIDQAQAFLRTLGIS